MLMAQLEIMHEEGLTLMEKQLKLESTCLEMAQENFARQRRENLEVCDCEYCENLEVCAVGVAKTWRCVL